MWQLGMIVSKIGSSTSKNNLLKMLVNLVWLNNVHLPEKVFSLHKEHESKVIFINSE